MLFHRVWKYNRRFAFDNYSKRVYVGCVATFVRPRIVERYCSYNVGATFSTGRKRLVIRRAFVSGEFYVFGPNGVVRTAGQNRYIYGMSGAVSILNCYLERLRRSPRYAPRKNTADAANRREAGPPVHFPICHLVRIRKCFLSTGSSLDETVVVSPLPCGSPDVSVQSWCRQPLYAAIHVRRRPERSTGSHAVRSLYRPVRPARIVL